MDDFTPDSLPRAPHQYLGQSTFWQSQDGTIRPIVTMHTSHLKNLIPWLYRHAEQLLLMEYADLSYAMLSTTAEAASDMIESEARYLSTVSAEEWVRESALMHAIVAEIDRREGRIEL